LINIVVHFMFQTSGIFNTAPEDGKPLDNFCCSHALYVLQKLLSTLRMYVYHFLHIKAKFHMQQCWGLCSSGVLWNYVAICLPTFQLTIFKGQAVQKDSSWTAFPLEMKPIGFAKMSVNSYEHPLHNNLEQRRLHIRHGRSLKSQCSFRSAIFHVWQNHKWIGMHICT
jgi:hypothetical protein